MESQSQAFTLEAFVRLGSVQTQAFLTKYNSNGNQRSYWFGMDGSNIRFIYSTTGGIGTTIDRTFAWSTGVWYHVAAERDDQGTFRMFVNGTQVGTSANLSGVTFFNGTATFGIGASRVPGVDNDFDGWIDEVRATIGVHQYGGDFTPPQGPFAGMALGDLLNVSVPAPNDGEVLAYDSAAGVWVAAAGGGGASVLDDLSDAATNYTSGSMYLGQGAGPGATGSSNVFLGMNAGNAVTTGGEHVFIGRDAGIADTSPGGNVYLGFQAGKSQVSGNGNTYIGHEAGRDADKNSNTYIGSGAAAKNANGSENIYMGAGAGGNGTNGSKNVFIGNSTAYSAVMSEQVVIGYEAGNALTNGANNTLLGFQAGNSLTTGSNNIMIGHDVDTPANNTSNYMNLGDIFFGSGIGTTAGSQVGAANYCDENFGSCFTAADVGGGDNLGDHTAEQALDMATFAINNLANPSLAQDAATKAYVDSLTGANETDPQVSATTNGQWCRGNGSAVTCDQSPPVTAETDPQVGTLTASKWCTTDGSVVNCTSDAPSGDDLGNHTATTNINLGANYLSRAGTAAGLSLDASNNATFSGDLTISGDDLFMATNTSGRILVADGTNYNPVAMSGDVTINGTGATAIGANKITEVMLKSVNAATDEYCLTYETTTGDFEWQTCVAAETDPQVNTLTSGKWCTTDGSVVNCTSDAPGATPAGADTQIQFNNSGAFGASANLTYDGTTLGVSSSAAGATVISGVSTSTTSVNVGVHGEVAAGTQNMGVFGKTASNGYGVFGQATTGTGVRGNATSGRGMWGRATAVSGTNYGVYGESGSASGYAGYFDNTAGGWGLYSADDMGLTAGKYLNWGTTRGSTGYGIRDNAGTIECKDSGGAWSACAGGGGSIAIDDLSDASYNAALDILALGDGSGNSGSFNVVVGIDALRITTGQHNTAFGYRTLYNNSSGSSNIGMGYLAMGENTSGSYNLAIGEHALYNNTTGQYNTAFGFQASGNSAATNGDMDGNALFGYRAGYNLEGGASGAGANYNTLIGYQAGDVITTGDNNIIIGKDTDPPTATTSNHLNIGNTIYGDLSTGNVGIGTTTPDTKLDIENSASAVMRLSDTGAGGFGTLDSGVEFRYGAGGGSLAAFVGSRSNGKFEIGVEGSHTASLSFNTQGAERMRMDSTGNICGADTAFEACSSDARLKKDVVPLRYDLDVIRKLNPVTFSWNEKGVGLYGYPANERRPGFLAQEVLTVMPEWVKTDEKGYYTVDDGDLRFVLLSAVKQLAEQNDELRAENERLRAASTAQDALLKQIQHRLDRLEAADEREASLGGGAIRPASISAGVSPAAGAAR